MLYQALRFCRQNKDIKELKGKSVGKIKHVELSRILRDGNLIAGLPMHAIYLCKTIWLKVFTDTERIEPYALEHVVSYCHFQNRWTDHQDNWKILERAENAVARTNISW